MKEMRVIRSRLLQQNVHNTGRSNAKHATRRYFVLHIMRGYQLMHMTPSSAAPKLARMMDGVFVMVFRNLAKATIPQQIGCLKYS